MERLVNGCRNLQVEKNLSIRAREYNRKDAKEIAKDAMKEIENNCQNELLLSAFFARLGILYSQLGRHGSVHDGSALYLTPAALRRDGLVRCGRERGTTKSQR